MIIASVYPCPFDAQDRHEINASIIKDGEIYAYEEAKFTGTKLEGTVKFPERSLMMGCKELGILPSQIDKWVFPTPSKPVELKDQYLFFSWLFKAYKGKWEDFEAWHKTHVCFVDHQMSHAALAVLASDFKECAFVCQDNGGDFGDQRNLIMGEYKDGKFFIMKEHFGLKTLCSFHAFITDALGFAGGDNGKTDGLAAYGKVQDSLAEKYLSLLSIEENGVSFSRERYGITEVNLKKVRPSEYERSKIFCQYPSNTNVLQMSLEYLPQDIAATAEYVLQTTFLKFLKKIRAGTSMKHVVFSGGLFQNVALNNKILESRLFDQIFIPMAPSDAGLSLGQALYVENETFKRKRDTTLSPFLGPTFKADEIRPLLDRFRLNYTSENDISSKVAGLIAQGNTIGWFQGRGEFGPRSLGTRSILADPRNLSSKSRVNQFLKRRDWFMPYAPSIQEEYLHQWVEIPHKSPYMQIAFKVIEEKRNLIPAAVHINGSSRFHVVKRIENAQYWNLIDHYRKLTGIPMVLNTSFNRHGIATISTPRQAIEHLLEGCMDYLAIDHFLVDFTKNRIVSQSSIVEKPEDVLLAENCIERLKDVCGYADKEKVTLYIAKLSELVGARLDYENGRFIIDEEGKFSVSDATERLIERVNRPLNV